MEYLGVASPCTYTILQCTMILKKGGSIDILVALGEELNGLRYLIHLCSVLLELFHSRCCCSISFFSGSYKILGDIMSGPLR